MSDLSIPANCNSSSLNKECEVCTGRVINDSTPPKLAVLIGISSFHQ